MYKILIIACCTWGLVASQGQFDYYDYDALAEAPAPQQIAAQPPPQAFAPQTRSQAPARSRQQASRPPPVQQVSRQNEFERNDLTTPVPIVKDSRRIDTKTGAFVYEYAGADGSAKHEYRYPNGTVIGNYTFINDLGERETRTYTAGIQDPFHVDETTDPNYVDLGNYDLYKHLEQPYVHADGFSEPRRPSPRPSAPQQAARPRAQGPRPAPRQSAPLPPPPPPQAPVPLDFNDETALFSQAPSAGAPVFDYEDIAVQPVRQPLPAPPPQFAPSQPSSRGRQGGRQRAQAPVRGPPHRLDFSGPSDSILDSIISQFN